MWNSKKPTCLLEASLLGFLSSCSYASEYHHHSKRKLRSTYKKKKNNVYQIKYNLKNSVYTYLINRNPTKGICFYLAQVIFHAVEQLKLLQSEEIIHSSTNTASPSTSPITLTDQDQQTTSQDSSTSVTITQEESNAEEEESNSEDSSRNKEEQTSQQPLENRPVDSKIEEETEEAKVDEASTDEVEGSRVEETSKGSKIEETSSDEAGEKKASETKMDKMEGTSKDAMAKPVESTEDRTGVEESPELNEETPEANYATPETNYEKPEEVHAVEETNQEVEEENHEWISSIDAETRVEVTTALANPADSDRVTIIGKHDEKKEPTIDSVVQGVYEILKPTTSKFVDEELFEESKSIVGVSVEKMERAEEESDENR